MGKISRTRRTKTYAAVLAAPPLILLNLFLTFVFFTLVIYRPPEIDPARLKGDGSFVNANGGRVHYVARGSGKPVILLHGLGAWSFTWRKNIDSLSRDFRVYAVDLKGFGLSDKPPGTAYSLDDQAELVFSFMDAAKVDRAVIAGNSLGGAVALRMYAKHPERIDALILVDSAGYQTAPGRTLRRPLPNAARLVFARGLILSKWWVRRELASCFADPELVTDEMVNGYYLPMQTRGMEDAILGIWSGLKLSNDTRIIKSVRVPTLIVWGRSDPVIHLRFAYRFESDIPYSKLVVIDKVGHVPQEESPTLFNEIVRDFVSNVK